MGSSKALLTYRGRTFLEHLLEVTQHPQIGAHRIVLGAKADEIRNHVRLDDADVVINPDWNLGQLSSIHAALRSLSRLPRPSRVRRGGPREAQPRDAAPPPALSAPVGALLAAPAAEGRRVDGMLLALVDHPLITRALVSTLVDQFYSHRKLIVIPTYRGKRGHPVIFPSTLFEELRSAPLRVGARAVVWAHAAEVLEIPTDEEGVVLNLNDPEVLRRALENADADP